MQAMRIDEATAPPRQRRRWGRTIAVVALLLLAYGLALAWATRRLEADVQRSLHPLPAVQHDAARADD
jgi:ferric-dicitrate binding protein FerR (iron transport regulator)